MGNASALREVLLFTSVSAAASEAVPGFARGTVAFVDVLEAPRDLRPGVRSIVDPVRLARIAHLVARIRLRDPAGAGSFITCAVVPVALRVPQLVEVLELRRVVPTRVLLPNQVPGDLLVLRRRIVLRAGGGRRVRRCAAAGGYGQQL